MSSINTDIKTLLQQELSRKEFLQIAGAGILATIGVTTALQNIAKLAAGSQSATTQFNSNKSSSGYGASPYGR